MRLVENFQRATEDPSFLGRFAFRPTRSAIGGLMICGLSWGEGVRDRQRASVSIAPREFFSDAGDRGEKVEKYSGTLTTWLNLWGAGLKSSAPTEFDHAISQTNFSLHQAQHHDGTTDIPYREAEERLADSLDVLRPSGLLFCGLNEFSSLFWSCQSDHLKTYMPRPPWVETHEIGKEMKIRFLRSAANGLSVACIKHPTSRFNAPTTDSIRRAGEVMGPWVARVRDRWSEVQASL